MALPTMHAETRGDRLTAAAAVPTPAALCAAVAVLFVTRSWLDPMLELSRDAGGPGLGAVVNLVAIALTTLVAVANYRLLRPQDLLPFAAFLIVCVVGSVPSHDPIGVTRFLLGLVTIFGAYLLPLCLYRDDRSAEWLTRLIVLSAIVPAAYGFVEIATNITDPEFRAQSTFTHPNIFAYYLVVVLATILLRLSSERIAPFAGSKPLHVAALIVVTFLLVFTKTRSAWFSAALLLAFFALLIDRRALPLLVAIPALALLEPSIRERLLDAGTATDYVGTGIVMNSYEWRKALWASASSWIDERPLFGHGGLDTFFYYSAQFFPYVPRYVDGVYAHSVFVQLAFELGLAGLATFLFIVLHFSWRLLALRDHDRNSAVVGLALCIALLGLGYSDNLLYYLAPNWYFFLLLGTLVASSRNMPVRRTGLHFDRSSGTPTRRSPFSRA